MLHCTVLSIIKQKSKSNNISQYITSWIMNIHHYSHFGRFSMAEVNLNTSVFQLAGATTMLWSNSTSQLPAWTRCRSAKLMKYHATFSCFCGGRSMSASLQWLILGIVIHHAIPQTLLELAKGFQFECLFVWWDVHSSFQMPNQIDSLSFWNM